MKIAAMITTWVGLALVGLLGWVIPWVTSGDGDGPLYLAGAAARDAPDRAGLGALNAWYAGYGWVVIGALMLAFGLFAMFSSQRDRWVAAVGYLLGAGFLIAGGFGTFGGELGESTSGTMTFVGVMVVAVIMLVMAVLSFRRAAFIGALPGAIAALVGIAWSAWFMVDVDQTPALTVSVLGWGLPVGHILVLVGALLSIAVAGRNKTDQPADAGRGATDSRLASSA